MKLLIVGSIAYDTITTENNKVNDALGGSAIYAGISASWHFKMKNQKSKNDVGLVGVIGHDFLDSDLEKLKKKGLDISGINKEKGKTFRWSGSYFGNMEEAITNSTELNVFESFKPLLPNNFQNPEVVFCANMHPLIQLKVLDQSNPKKFVAVDSMNLWINNTKKELANILCNVEMAILNSDEVKMLANCDDLIEAGNMIRSGLALNEEMGDVKKGPEIIVIKKGGEGSLALINEDIIELPAYPTSKIVDPTGCGDSFAGALLAHLCLNNNPILTKEILKNALIHANITASFTIEGMGINGIEKLNSEEYEKRLDEYLKNLL